MPPPLDTVIEPLRVSRLTPSLTNPCTWPAVVTEIVPAPLVRARMPKPPPPSTFESGAIVRLPEIESATTPEPSVLLIMPVPLMIIAAPLVLLALIASDAARTWPVPRISIFPVVVVARMP